MDTQIFLRVHKFSTKKNGCKSYYYWLEKVDNGYNYDSRKVSKRYKL